MERKKGIRKGKEGQGERNQKRAEAILKDSDGSIMNVFRECSFKVHLRETKLFKNKIFEWVAARWLPLWSERDRCPGTA